MYYANTVYTVERTRLTTPLMIYSMRTWAIVRNPPPFNNTPVLADPVYYKAILRIVNKKAYSAASQNHLCFLSKEN